jgi:hypothetical protein
MERRCCPMLSDAVCSFTMLYDTVRCFTMLSDAVRCCPMLWDVVRYTKEHFLFESFQPSPVLIVFAKFRKAALSFIMSVRLSARNNSVPTGRIFMKFDI